MKKMKGRGHDENDQSACRAGHAQDALLAFAPAFALNRFCGQHLAAPVEVAPVIVVRNLPDQPRGGREIPTRLHSGAACQLVGILARRAFTQDTLHRADDALGAEKRGYWPRSPPAPAAPRQLLHAACRRAGWPPACRGGAEDEAEAVVNCTSSISFIIPVKSSSVSRPEADNELLTRPCRGGWRRSLRTVLLYSMAVVAALHGHENAVAAMLHRQCRWLTSGNPRVHIDPAAA